MTHHGIMAKRIVILGGGTGGTLSANRLRRVFPLEDVEIVVVDQNDDHVYQPGLLFVPFGLTHTDEIVRSRRHQLHGDIEFRQIPIERVDIDAETVHLEDGTELSYDVLVVASGSILVKEETEGLTGPGWMEKVFTFYDVAGAAALHGALEGFDGGRLVVNVVDMPIKCPVAPLEFCFLADWVFQQSGIRDRVELTYVTPLDGAFTKPVASKALGGLLEEKGVELVTEFNTGEVDGSGGRLVSYDGREVAFDLAVVVPLHGGATYVARSPGLGDELGFVPVDEHTLQSTAKPNVFAIGDAAGVPTSKAGSVTHFEGEVLVENVRRFLADEPLDGSFDGHTNCFIETGFGKALLIDFNYDTEPLPGHFPTSVGLPLLKESRLNHLGKLMFQPLYWHSLLPGRDLPGVGTAMPTRGKDFQSVP
jgi:sulfide:quinone oxidoreductase